MQIKIITSAFVTLLLISSQTFASPGEDVLDDLTIRVFTNENMSDSVQLIALPNIMGEHNVNHPNAANNANEHADLAADNAADAAKNGGAQGGGAQGGGGNGGGGNGGGGNGGGGNGGGGNGGGKGQ